MGAFNDFMNEAMPTLTDEFFGDESTYYPVSGDPVPDVYAVLTYDVVIQPPTYDSVAAITGTVLEVLYEECGEPVRGAYFVIGSTTWKVSKTLENNHNTVKLVVHDD